MHKVGLINKDDKLILKDFANDLAMEIDFVKQIKSLRAKKLAGENLLKAIGKKNKNLKIYDLTAGLGRDSLLMALAGYDVVMVEKNKLIFQMLNHAYEKLAREDNLLAKKISLINEDNYKFVKNMSVNKDILFYLDPMFAARVKTAKVKKEMQIMQQICEKTDNLEGLINLCLTKAPLVLKRPKFASDVINIEPHHIIFGNKINFIVFKP